LGDPLERLNKGIDFEIFREILEQHLTKQAKGKGGRRAYDYVLMFKILILQRYYNLSDDQVEYQIGDYSQVLGELLDTSKDKGEDLYGDSAYGGEKQLEIIKEKQMNNKVGEQGYKNSPLTDQQKESNKEKSKTRTRVEHVFGFMEMSMNGMYLYAIGIKRIEAIVGLMNLTWNMFRRLQIA